MEYDKPLVDYVYMFPILCLIEFNFVIVCFAILNTYFCVLYS